jgi:hypothetical protein
MLCYYSKIQIHCSVYLLTLKPPFRVRVHLNFKVNCIKFGDLDNYKMAVPEVKLILWSSGLSYSFVLRVSTRVSEN